MEIRRGLGVCCVPPENLPGEDVVEACANSDDQLPWAQAEALCKTLPALSTGVFPARSLTPGAQVSEEEEDLDDMLKDCMVDCCSSSPADRAAVLSNIETEVLGLAAISCPKLRRSNT